MKMRMRLSVWILFSVFLTSRNDARADDLLSVYRRAKQSSPVLAQAQASLRAEEYARAVARSALAPHLSAGGAVSRNRLDLSGFGPAPITEDYTASSYSVTLSQPLLSGRDRSALRAASARTLAATAATASAEQDLLLRTAQAYFEALRAVADERTARDRRRLLEETFHQAEVALRTGSGDRIAVQNAQAEYDAAHAAVLTAANAVRTAGSILQNLTHQPVGPLADLSNITPRGPDPDSREAWVQMALDSRPELHLADALVQARKHAATAAARAGWPVFSLNAGYSYADGAFTPAIERDEKLIGVTAAWPLFQGGGITAARREAEAMTEAARFAADAARDAVRLQTEQAFYAMQDSVAQWRAADQARASAALSLEATQKGFEVGARSMLDVLDAVRRRTDAETAWNRARYRHVLSHLQLQAAAGRLSEEDLVAINSWLQDPIQNSSDPPSGDSP